MNKENIKRAFTRSQLSYNQNARVQRMVAERVAYLLKRYRHATCQHIFEVGCGTGLLTKELLTLFDNDNLYINDLSEQLCDFTAREYTLAPSHCFSGDFETISLPHSIDIVVSSSVFQWFTHPKETLSKIYDSLNPEGLLIFSTFGNQNMHEFYQILNQQFLENKPSDYWQEMLNERFEILHFEESEHILYFDTLMEILQHLKQTGVTGCNEEPRNWTRGNIQSIEEEYRKVFLFCGKLPLTYHPQYFVCRKRA